MLPVIDTAPWITGHVTRNGRSIPALSTSLTLADRLGGIRVRWGMGRYTYTVTPGLYAVGQPDSDSPVLVTANYKLTVDRLRSQLSGIDSWVLVLDTKGINVWCAAGKGTFGTWELIGRIGETALDTVVSHRRLILPQLGAVGVKAHTVTKLTGYKIVYGPVRAEDIPAFIAHGMTATPAMRQVTFPAGDRVALIPMEMIPALKYTLPIALALLVLSGFGQDVFSIPRLLAYGPQNASILIAAAVWASVLVPLLLPWLPGRAFAVKGAVAGGFGVLIVIGLTLAMPGLFRNGLHFAAWVFAIPALGSFIGMNFTGSSTYTSLSGVMKEMRIGIPVQAAGALIAATLWIAGLFVS